MSVANPRLSVTADTAAQARQAEDPIVHSGEGNFLPVPECAQLFESRTRAIRGGRLSVRTDRGTAVALSPPVSSWNPDRHI